MLYFIVNPSSSSGKGGKIWQKIQALLRQRKVDYQTILLSGPGEAKTAARQLSEKARGNTLVVLGGDGTINEFISGLPSFREIRFAYLPTGSGNDFARGLKLPADPEEALEQILRSSPIRPIDIGSVLGAAQEGSFAVSSGIGFDAAVCYESARSRVKPLLNRLHLGKLIYTVTAVRLLFAMKPLSMKILVDDHRQLSFERTYFAAAMNTKYEGGGFMFCPDADPCDGFLDLIVAEGLPKWKVLMIMPLAMKGKHTKKQGIHILRCQKAVLQTDRKAHVHTDGEHYGLCKSITWSLKEERLCVVSK